MWAKVTRRKYERLGLRCASDMTREEWPLIAPLLPAPKRRGRPRSVDLRAVVDAILYLVRSGCAWRLLPKDFPPPSTVQRYYCEWRDNGLWQKINQVLLMAMREAE